MLRPYFFVMNNSTLKIFLLFAVILAITSTISCAGPQKPFSDGPIDFPYLMQGESYSLSQLHGKPLMLVLVRTSEVTNEMHLDQIQKVVPQLKGRVTVLILTIASNEAPMLDMFVEFHDYPFHIGIADWSVADGQSPLGRIPDVPTTYFINENGHIIDLLPGAMNEEKIIGSLRSHHFIP
ncbi:MAG: hypothetical protein JXX29_09370 [Deltaproteobacteria bacterium]|nr:hypothetical protein [Deltaproteobacteria bacterium]MBN2671873.1 hypothetical protein [Deltaproteobacteria bacterium]